MPATFSSGQTFMQMSVLQAVESFGRVEVELVAPDAVLQLEEALHQLDLRSGVFDQSVTVDDMQLPPREHVQPPTQELGVQRYV